MVNSTFVVVICTLSRLPWLLLRNAVDPAAAAGQVSDIYLYHLAVRKTGLDYRVGSSVARDTVRGHHDSAIGYVEIDIRSAKHVVRRLCPESSVDSNDVY